MSKAFRFHHHGGPEVLRLEEVEVGAPGPVQVRIRNSAVAVKNLKTGEIAPVLFKPV